MMDKGIFAEKKEIILRNKRCIMISTVVAILLCGIAFFRAQMDDERYYNLYSFDNVEEDVYDNSEGVLFANEGNLSPGDLICEIPALYLEPGKYALQIDHQQDTDSIVQIDDGENVIASYNLPASELDSVFTFSSDRDLYQLSVRFIYQGGNVKIKHAYLRSDGLFYSDTIVITVLLILGILFLTVYAVKKDLFFLGNRERLFYLAFPAFFVFVNYVFFREYTYSMSGDIGYLISRIEGTKNELLMGQFPVQIYGDNLSGHGMLASLYPNLFLYIPAILRVLHVSMELTFRLTWMTANGATMATSYYAIKRISGNRIASFLGMIVYVLLPYRLGAVYYACAFGEVMAMMFFPLIVAGLYEVLIGDKRRWVILAMGFSGILQSHVLSTLLTVCFCLLMGVLLIRQLFREGRIISILKAVGLVILLNLWYLVPFWECYHYDLKTRDMFAVMDFSSMAIWPSEFFTLLMSFLPGTGILTDSRYRTPMLGLSLWLFAAMLIYFVLFIKGKDEKDRFIEALFLSSLWYLFMSSRVFPWQTLQKFELIKKAVQMIQFPIRFGQIAQAGLTIAGAVILVKQKLFRPYVGKVFAFCCISSCILTIAIIDSWLLKAGVTELGDMKFVSGIQDSAYEDFAMHDYNRDKYPKLPESNAEISGWTKNGTRAEFDYRTDADTEAELPIMAYPGYMAITRSGEYLDLTQGSYAMMQVQLPASVEWEHVTVTYEQPLRWRIALLISVITIVVLGWCCITKNNP